MSSIQKLKISDNLKLAFYYHIPLNPDANHFFVPGYLGVFIDSIANEVDALYLVMHKANTIEISGCDYQIKSKNIIWINLGLKTPAWHRAIFHSKILKRTLGQIADCEVFLVRSPSPLAPYFHKYIKQTKLVFLVVGDYAESATQKINKNFRDIIINLYLKNNDYLFRKRMLHTDVIANSPVLFEKYKENNKSIHLIKTTTLSKDDFFYRKDTCLNPTIQILYTGLIDSSKGLFELVEAVALLKQTIPNIKLNLVGWEEDEQSKPIKQALQKKADELGIGHHIIFHGKKSIGEELNTFYRMADIYVIPSYEEGFPRTIWEAMANSVPVVATTVGGIPYYLKNKIDAILIKPRSAEDIATAINTIIENPELRQSLISNGMKQAENNTLEYQSKKLLNIITNLQS